MSPVKGAADEIKALDPEAATNPLLFPDAATAGKFHSFQALSEEQEAADERAVRDPLGHLGSRIG